MADSCNCTQRRNDYRALITMAGIVISLLVVVITSWINMNSRVRALEVETHLQWKLREEQKNDYKEILIEIKEIRKSLPTIKKD